jgi:hypothetical protein
VKSKPRQKKRKKRKEKESQQISKQGFGPQN